MSEDMTGTTQEDNVTPIRPLCVHPGIAADLDNVRAIETSINALYHFLHAEAKPETQHFSLWREHVQCCLRDIQGVTAGFIESYDADERNARNATL